MSEGNRQEVARSSYRPLSVIMRSASAPMMSQIATGPSLTAAFPLRDRDQHLVLLDAVPGPDADPVNRPITRRLEFVLHLHRLEDNDRIPFGDGLPFLDRHAHDQARHRRADRHLA